MRNKKGEKPAQLSEVGVTEVNIQHLGVHRGYEGEWGMYGCRCRGVGPGP